MRNTLLVTLFVVALVINACGGDEEGGECLTKSTEFFTCDGDSLYSCPAGDGSWVPMEFARNCADDGMTCDRVTDSCIDPDGHIVSDDATKYTEKDIATADIEDTGYTADIEGLEISGSFADGDADTFLFNTGTFGRVNIQVFVDGKAQTEENYVVSIGLDAATDDGYSSLFGHGYFNNAWVQAGGNYELSLSGTALTGNYTVEIKGNEE